MRLRAGTVTFSKITSAVSDARSPSFSIFFPFERPAVPRSTMNADTPSRPRAWSVIAITTYTSATVPLVMNIFEPVIE